MPVTNKIVSRLIYTISQNNENVSVHLGNLSAFLSDLFASRSQIAGISASGQLSCFPSCWFDVFVARTMEISVRSFVPPKVGRAKQMFGNI